MSHILLKKVPSSAITAPGTTDVKFFSNFNDNGLLYYIDSSGNPLPVGGSTYNPVTNITYSGLYSLYTGSQFATGSYYLITDFYTAYEQPDYYFDGTLKTGGMYKTSPVTPLLVLATAKDKLSPYATQPGFPNDKIIYDISWDKTEFVNNSRGRIIERVDSNNNRTDYDHRSVRFKRYQGYERDTQINGYITDFDCVNGAVTGSSTTFISDITVGDVIIFDSKSDVGYDIGVKVTQVVDDFNLYVQVDSLYSGGVPSPVTLHNSVSSIYPVNYSFNSKTYTAWKTNATANYNSYKEVYFAQSDNNDYDSYYTFNLSQASNNTLSNYSYKYLSGDNNTLVLPNNIISGMCYNNTVGGWFYNNTLTSAISNTFTGDVYGNTLGQLRGNSISKSFYNNVLGDIESNIFFSPFYENFSSSSLVMYFNNFKTELAYYDFSSSTYIYNPHNCEIFSNSLYIPRLSYYDSYDVLNIVNVTD